MATKIYRVKSKGVKMIIRRRGSDYADSEFDLWGGTLPSNEGILSLLRFLRKDSVLSCLR